MRGGPTRRVREARGDWRLSVVPCAVLVSAACGPVEQIGGGDPTPFHPDSLTAVPSLPTAEADGDVVPAASAAGPPAASAGSSPAGSGDATYRVEPGSKYPSLSAVAPLLGPGDVVEIVGGYSYVGGTKFERSGTAEAKITIRGVPRNGKLPILQGGQNTIEAAGDHYVFENLEITGGARRCFFHHAHDITLRASLVRDCPQQGILGADTDSGSLTVELCEVTRSGSGTYNHPLYIATDEKAHPGSVFRLVQSYIHDGNGGNNVKTRAERNEILYNWIENATYHELEMVGPDGQDPKLAREDGQVVGNVFFKSSDGPVVRVGGDGTGETGGRYRFVNNTFVVGGETGVIRLFGSVESVELFNNAFYRTGGSGGVRLFRDDEVKWATGSPVVSGKNNWFPAGSSTYSTLGATKIGGSGIFAAFSAKDLRPPKGSPLAGAGTSSTSSEGKLAFPGALSLPDLEPPRGKAEPGKKRAVATKPAIGAFEP